MIGLGVKNKQQPWGLVSRRWKEDWVNGGIGWIKGKEKDLLSYADFQIKNNVGREAKGGGKGKYNFSVGKDSVEEKVLGFWVVPFLICSPQIQQKHVCFFKA